MGKIKGWRKLKASDKMLSSWVANEGQSNETILALLRAGDKNTVVAVRKNPGSQKGRVLWDMQFEGPVAAYDFAISWMRGYPNG